MCKVIHISDYGRTQTPSARTARIIAIGGAQLNDRTAQSAVNRKAAELLVKEKAYRFVSPVKADAFSATGQPRGLIRGNTFSVGEFLGFFPYYQGFLPGTLIFRGHSNDPGDTTVYIFGIDETPNGNFIIPE